MAVHYKTWGFVFKKEDRLEADRVFSVFTADYGRVEIFGRAIRKIASKLKGGIEIFYISDIEFIQGKNKKTLTDAVVQEKFNSLAKVPEKLEAAQKIATALDAFIKGEEKDSKVLDIIIESFKKIDSTVSQKELKLIYYYFFWNFISLLGYAPELSVCVKCGEKLEPEYVYFSNKEGGVIGKNCFTVKKEDVKILPDVIKILRLLLKKDWKILSKLKIEESIQKSLQEISDSYYNYLVNK